MSIDTLSTEGRALRVAEGKWVESSSDMGSCYTRRDRVHVTVWQISHIHEVKPLYSSITD